MAAPWEEYSSEASTETAAAPWEEFEAQPTATQPVTEPAQAQAEAAPWEDFASAEPTKDRSIVDAAVDLGQGAIAGFTDVGYAGLEGVAAAVGAATGDNEFARAVSDYRNFAKDFYAGDVSDEVKDSFSYKASSALGAVPAYAAASATGPAGWAFLLSTGSQAGRDDYLSTQGVTTENATEEQLSEANKVGAMTAVPMMLLEKFGAGKLVNSVFKGGGKLTAKEVAKRVASASLSEGATEGLQTAMQNTIASQIAKFDPDREITQDVLESMALGAIASGGMATAGNTTAMAIDKLQGGIAEGNINPSEMNSELGQGLMSTAVDSDSIPVVGSSFADKSSVLSDAKYGVDKIIQPISSQFKRIAPALHRELLQFERRRGMETNRRMDSIEPFAAGLAKIRKANSADYNRITKALFHGEGADTAAFEGLLNKYELTNAFASVRAELDSIKEEAKGIGMDMNEIENYFPREVQNLKGLKRSYGEDVPSGVFDRLVHEREAVTGKKLTPRERALLYESFAKKSVSRKKTITPDPNSLKKRTTEHITDDRLQYYKRPEKYLVQYIENIVNSMETRKLIGANEIDGERVAGRLGQVIDQEVQQGNITDEDSVRIQDLVEARFGSKKPMNSVIRGIKNAGYLAVMGNPGSAVTQLGDFMFSVIQNGPMETAKAAIQNKDITLHDIGVDPNMVTVEANEGGYLHHAVNTVFKATGLTGMDRLAKNTNINAAWNSMQKLAKMDLNHPKRKKLVDKLKRFQGSDHIKTMADLRNGKKSELVMEVLYHQIADVAPISMSEMPPAYANNPNARIAYQLKSYTIKQFDFFRQNSFSKIASGNRKEMIEGMGNLLKMATIMAAGNASADVIKDFMFNREIDPEDIMWDNVLRMFGMNRYAAKNAGRKGIGSGLIDLLSPPQIRMADDFYKDLRDMPDVEDARSIKYFPFVGKLYDKWMGRGSQSQASAQ